MSNPYTRAVIEIFGSYKNVRQLVKVTDITPGTVLLLHNYKYDLHDPIMIPAKPVLDEFEGVYRGIAKITGVKQTWGQYHYYGELAVQPFNSQHHKQLRVARGGIHLHDGDWFIPHDQADKGHYVFNPTLEQWKEYYEYIARLDAERVEYFNSQQTASISMITRLTEELKQQQSL